MLSSIIIEILLITLNSRLVEMNTKIYSNSSFSSYSEETERYSGNTDRTALFRTVYGLVLLPFCKIIVSFFSCLCQDANKARSNCAIIGCNLSKKHKVTLYKEHRTENQTTLIISFSLIFTRSYLPVQNLGDRHPNTIELAS